MERCIRSLRALEMLASVIMRVRLCVCVCDHAYRSDVGKSRQHPQTLRNIIINLCRPVGTVRKCEITRRRTSAKDLRGFLPPCVGALLFHERSAKARRLKKDRERGGVIYEENGSKPFASTRLDFDCDNVDEHCTECIRCSGPPVD